MPIDQNSSTIQVRVGPKGRIAVVPDDYFVVTEGIAKLDDMFANTVTAKFQNVTTEDIGLPFDAFDCLVRPKKPQRV